MKKKLAARIYDAYDAIFPSPPKRATRHYAAARVNRLNADWTTQPTGVNYETRVSLATLIARSRQAARDDLHIVNYLRLMRANVIGQNGIQLQSRARMLDGKTLNVELNKRVEEAWWQWCHAETCTLSGKLDWKAVQNLAVTQCERDGAFLIQLVDGADNEWGFALRTWDVTWLDFTYNDTLPSGNRVIMSVEVDAGDKPVAYWMTTPASEINFVKTRTRTRTRVPAEQIIHGMLVHDDESQVHGIPGTAAALLPTKHAYSYEESVVLASRQCVNDFAVLKNTNPDGEPQFIGAENSDGEQQNPFIDSRPLAITQLLPGWEMDWRNPTHPTQNHTAFSENLDLKIAAALGIPYFLLMGNWTAVNFSSSRGGLGEFRERCKSYQSFIATTLCRKVFHAWLRAAFLNGQLKITAQEYLEVENPEWIPRGYDYIDPTKDIAADVLKLQNRLATPSELLGERGRDAVDFCERWQSDVGLFGGYGIDIEEIYTDQPKQLAAAPAEGEESDMDDVEEIKRRADAYGVGVRAGVITPQTDDENQFRESMGLPPLSAEATKAWQTDGGVRRPITLVSSDGSRPAAAGGAAGTGDDEPNNEDPPPDKKKRGYSNGHDSDEMLN